MRERLGAVLATIVSGGFCMLWALVPISRLYGKIGQDPPADLLVHHLLTGVLPRMIVTLLLVVAIIAAFRRGQMLGYVVALAAMPIALAADMLLLTIGLG